MKRIIRGQPKIKVKKHYTFDDFLELCPNIKKSLEEYELEKMDFQKRYKLNHGFENTLLHDNIYDEVSAGLEVYSNLDSEGSIKKMIDFALKNPVNEYKAVINDIRGADFKEDGCFRVPGAILVQMAYTLHK